MVEIILIVVLCVSMLLIMLVTLCAIIVSGRISNMEDREK